MAGYSIGTYTETEGMAIYKNAERTKLLRATGCAQFILMCHNKRAIASVASAATIMGVAKCCRR